MLISFAAWPALVLIWAILTYGVNVPVADEWSPTMAGLFIKSSREQLTIGDFLAQHNEHRIIVPRVILFVLGSLTYMNKVVEMAASWVVACLMSLGLLQIILRTSQSGTPEQIVARLDGRTATLWLICNLLLFTPSGWETWLTGFNFANILPVAIFVGIAVVAISRLTFWTKTVATVVLAMAATWSTGNGLLAWPLAGVLLSWSDSWRSFRQKRSAVIVLVAVFVANLVVFALTYEDPPEHAELHAKTISQVIQHNVVFMGNSFAYVVNLPLFIFAAITGAVLFLILVGSTGYFFHVWLNRNDVSLAGRMLVWLAFAGVSFISGLMASVMRAALGVDQAASSRYLIHSLFLSVAVVNLVPIICGDIESRLAARERRDGSVLAALLGRAARQAPVFLAGIILVLALMAFSHGLYRCEHEFRLRRNAKASLLLANVIPDYDRIRALISPKPQETVEMAQRLSELGYIQPPLIATNNVMLLRDPYHAQTRGRLEKYWQSGFDKVSIAGWACAPGSWRAADAVLLTYDDANGNPIIFALALPVEQRPDLVQHYGVTALVYAGWQLDLPFDRVPVTGGAVRICAWVLDVDTATAVKLDGEAILARS